MIQRTDFGERVREALAPSSRGTVGVVEDLMRLCQTHDLYIEFADGRCQIRDLDAEARDVIFVPIPKSAFRAVLARFGALCNEHRPGAVTPYRGEGEIAIPAEIVDNEILPHTCHIAFTNTPSELRLELKVVKEPPASN